MRWSILTMTLFSGALQAQSENQAGTVLEPMSSPYLLKLTGGLILIVALIFLLAWLVRKFNLNQQSHSGLIRIIAGLSIGTRDRIVLLQIGEEQILVGLTPGKIEKLHTLSQPLDVPGEPSAVAGSFASKLNRLMGDRESS
jgi:flagellar protein FliO/FliZ